MGYDTKDHLWVPVYVICGMSLGILMELSHHHIHYVSHANIFLVGFVLSLLHGIIHKLWLVSHTLLPRLCPATQIILHIHQAGALTMFTALLLLYGGVFLDQQIEPFPAIASVTALIATMTTLHMVKLAPAVNR